MGSASHALHTTNVRATWSKRDDPLVSSCELRLTALPSVILCWATVLVSWLHVAPVLTWTLSPQVRVPQALFQDLLEAEPLVW